MHVVFKTQYKTDFEIAGSKYWRKSFAESVERGSNPPHGNKILRSKKSLISNKKRSSGSVSTGSMGSTEPINLRRGFDEPINF